MLWSLFYYIVVSFAVLAALLLIKVSYRYSKAMARLKFYQEQGMFVYPGADRLLIGNLFDSLAYRTAS